MEDNRELWVRRIMEEAQALGREGIVDMDKWPSGIFLVPPVGTIYPPL